MLAERKKPAKRNERPRRTRGRPRLEQVADIDRELLDVALNEFLKHGYGETSMATIVKVAGVSKTTLYSRYSSKQELFVAIMQKLLDSSLVSRLLTMEDEPPVLEQGLREYARQSFEISGNDLAHGLDRLLYSEAYRFPELAEVAESLVMRSIEAISDFIARCAEAEGVPCQDPRAPAEAYLAMIRGFYTQTMHSQREFSADEQDALIDRVIGVLLKSRADW